MSISTLGPSAPLQSLIQQTMAAADVDKNGQLSANEFASFFTTLLQGLAGKTTGATVNSSLAALNLTVSPPTLTPVPGFDTRKLNDLGYVNAKYTPAVRVFAQGLATLGLDAVASRGHLQPLADFAKQNGFPDAKTVSDDQIDFGDGYGPVDCITSWGTWSFQNQK